MKLFEALKRTAENASRFLPRINGGLSPTMIAFDAGVLLVTLAAGAYFFYVSTLPDEREEVSVRVDSASLVCRVLPETDGDSLLSELGIALRVGDEVALDDGGAVSVTRAFPVSVATAGSVTVLRMTGGTVGEALREADVKYDVADELSHMAFEDAVPGMRIVHTDVQTEYNTSYKTLDYSEEAVYDDTKYNDSDPEILQQGEDGTKQVTQRIVYKDGLEVSREVVDQVVVDPAVSEITLYGSKIHYMTHYTGETRLYKKKPTAGVDGWVEMTVNYITAYTGDGRTSTGTRTGFGTIAVNTFYIPYGTEIWVPGYGYGKARDTGAFRNYKNSDGTPVNQLDIWFQSNSDANRWGRKRNVTVLVRLGK